jgi:hypothetical protein
MICFSCISGDFLWLGATSSEDSWCDNTNMDLWILLPIWERRNLESVPEGWPQGPRPQGLQPAVLYYPKQDSFFWWIGHVFQCLAGLATA